MQLIRLKGVKQDRHGTTFQVIHVDSSGNAIDDEQALGFLEFDEQGSVPAAPAANAVRLYAQDNGSGKTRIVARFATGADVVLATQA